MRKQGSSAETASGKIDPERLSGRKLADHLISHPQASGNFQWHTLNSSMWVRLLSACPQFAPYGDYEKITRQDLIKILTARRDLVTQVKTEKLFPCDWVELLVVHPELAVHCDFDWIGRENWLRVPKIHPGLPARLRRERIRMTEAWSNLLKVRPEFADRCPWKMLAGSGWNELLIGRPEFYEHCRWDLLKPADWDTLIREQPGFLSRYTLKYFDGVEHYSALLECSYRSEDHSPGGLFKEFVGDPASFMICKSMDADNARKYLRKCVSDGNWDFLEQLHDLAPEELGVIARKGQAPFLIALKAPETLFRKFFRSADPELRDEAGNTLLHCALIHDRCTGQGDRYRFLLEKGCDADVRNAAGFSCNELLGWLEKRSRRRKSSGRTAS